MKKALVIFSALFLVLLMVPEDIDAQVKSRRQLNKDRKALRKKVKESRLSKSWLRFSE